jgi:hypothetical protein
LPFQARREREGGLRKMLQARRREATDRQTGSGWDCVSNKQVFVYLNSDYGGVSL